MIHFFHVFFYSKFRLRKKKGFQRIFFADGNRKICGTHKSAVSIGSYPHDADGHEIKRIFCVNHGQFPIRQIAALCDQKTTVDINAGFIVVVTDTVPFYHCHCKYQRHDQKIKPGAFEPSIKITMREQQSANQRKYQQQNVFCCVFYYVNRMRTFEAQNTASFLIDILWGGS